MAESKKKMDQMELTAVDINGSTDAVSPDNASDKEPEIDADDIDKTILEPKELKGWYYYGWAADGYAAVGSAVLMPLIVEGMAARTGFESSDHSIPCNTTIAGYSCVVPIGSIYIQTSSFFFYCTVVSVICQLFLLISLGAMADHGSWRKGFLMWFSMISAVLTILFVTILKDSWFGYGAILYIISSICYSLASVFQNAYIPLFCRVHPDIVKLKDEGASKKTLTIEMDKIAHYLSSRGYFYAYAAGVVELIIGGALVVVITMLKLTGVPESFGMQCAVAFAGIWWIGFMYPTWKNLRVRPGPALPAGTSYIVFSWQRFFGTLKRAAKLKQLIIFLIAWFIFSDAFTTIIQVAVLFASNELKMGAVELLIVATIVPFTAAIGTLFWNWIQRFFKLSSRSTLIIVAALYGLLPLWGIVGIYSTSVGLRSKLELYILGIYHGFFLGAAQATCRAMFAELLPPGYESEFFSLYAITDKGSSWLGPLIVAAIGDATGSRRPSFWFLAAAFYLPIIFFYMCDMKKAKFEMAAFLESEREHRKQNKVEEH
ncbi:Autophagy protein 22 [Phlyctochytrium planicorne]|nr:Autophagy protein 22 [Phlyctochytrium planicorne]